jgi:hypothetical protein
MTPVSTRGLTRVSEYHFQLRLIRLHGGLYVQRRSGRELQDIPRLASERDLDSSVHAGIVQANAISE